MGKSDIDLHQSDQFRQSPVFDSLPFSLLRGKEFNEQVHQQHPGALTVAEESTAWGGVSRPTYLGGLGFGYKWDMGWMHDTLEYLHHDPIFRRYHALRYRSPRELACPSTPPPPPLYSPEPMEMLESATI